MESYYFVIIYKNTLKFRFHCAILAIDGGKRLQQLFLK